MKNELCNIYKQRIICKFEARVLDTSISLIVFSTAEFTQKSGSKGGWYMQQKLVSKWTDC